MTTQMKRWIVITSLTFISIMIAQVMLSQPKITFTRMFRSGPAVYSSVRNFSNFNYEDKELFIIADSEQNHFSFDDIMEMLRMISKFKNNSYDQKWLSDKNFMLIKTYDSGIDKWFVCFDYIGKNTVHQLIDIQTLTKFLKTNAKTIYAN